MLLLLLACVPSPEDSSEAPRVCPAVAAPTPADLDGDGAADLAWAQTEDADGVYDTTSVVTFGPDFSRRQEYPTRRLARRVLRQLLRSPGPRHRLAALLGAADGFRAEAVSWFPTHGATDALAVDLDGDNCLELVVANGMTGDFADVQFEVDSDVWEGSPDGPTELAWSLPTISAAAVTAADLDGDGDADLAFANRYDAAGGPVSTSYVYWKDGGFSADQRTEIATVGAAGVTAVVRK